MSETIHCEIHRTVCGYMDWMWNWRVWRGDEWSGFSGAAFTKTGAKHAANRMARKMLKPDERFEWGHEVGGK